MRTIATRRQCTNNNVKRFPYQKDEYMHVTYIANLNLQPRHYSTQSRFAGKMYISVVGNHLRLHTRSCSLYTSIYYLNCILDLLNVTKISGNLGGYIVTSINILLISSISQISYRPVGNSNHLSPQS